MSTIPFSYSVNVNPGVISAGGSAIDLNGLMLTTSIRVPIGAVMSFGSGPAVASYFGGTSQEASEATTYFAGFDNSTVKPAALLFAQYPASAVAGYLRGGNISGISIATLQGYSGLLSVAIDVGAPASATINLSGVTSFTGAAQLIETDLAISGVHEAAVTGTIAANVLTVSAVTTGQLRVGQKVTGAGVTAGSYIASFGTGTGGAGTYNLTQASTVAVAEAIVATAPAVEYDSLSGAFVIHSGTTGANSSVAFATGALAADLLLTQAAGAVQSPGAAAATPEAFMTSLSLVSQQWAAFTTLFDPDAGAGFANKLAFAKWTAKQNNRYAYACWDTSATAYAAAPSTASLGYAIKQAGYSGTVLLYEQSEDQELAAFVLGAIASINFSQRNGRTTLAYRSQSGLAVGVTDLTSAINLGGNPALSGDFGNGYNFYGAFAEGSQTDQSLQRGTISGDFIWLDSYVNQIWLNAKFRSDLWNFLRATGTVPYNDAGSALIKAALADTIQAGLDFGAFRGGVTLAASQKAKVDAYNPGAGISTVLEQQGWYLVIGTATTDVRKRRGTPPMTFLYVDGQSVQQITLGSIALQ